MANPLSGISHRLISQQRIDHSMDLLADALTNTRTGGVLFALTRLDGPWGFSFVGHRYWGFHMVTEGSCWLLVGQREPMLMQAGDLVIVGEDHELVDEPGRSVVPFGQDVYTSSIVEKDADCEVELACGAYDFESEVAHPIFSCLPSVMYVPAAERPPAIDSRLSGVAPANA